MFHATWIEQHLHIFNAADAAALRAGVGDLCDDPLLTAAAAEGRVETPAGSSPSLSLDPADALDLLGEIDRDDPRCGDSLRIFIRLGQFVLDRIEHGQFYPDLRTGAEPAAAWRLLISLEDEAFLKECAAALPPVCVAATGPGEFDEAATTAVTSFIAITADSLIRRDVSLDPFFHRAHELAGSASSPPEVRWMSALLGEDQRVRALVPEIEQLQQQIREWTSRLETHAAAELVRLRLRLEEPPLGDEEPDADPIQPAGLWRLSFELELLGDSPEVIDAEDLFAEDALLPTVSGRDIEGRRTNFREELTRAAGVYPLLDSVLVQPSPTHIELTGEQVYSFLRIFVPALRERGVGLTLPSFVNSPRRGLGLVLKAAPSGDSPSGGLGLENLLDFNWQVAVGDVRLTAEQFERLADTGGGEGGLVRFAGQWLEIDGDAARRALEFLRKGRGGKLTLAQALRAAYASNPSDTGLPVVGLEGEGSSWLGELLQQQATIEEFNQPAAFIGTLRPYQLRGLQWMAFLDRLGLGACLADDMGLGKTIQMIALLQHERADKMTRWQGDKVTEAEGAAPASSPCHLATLSSGHPLPTLLFAPTSVVSNWRRELERFAPDLRVLIHHGAERLVGEAFLRAAEQSDIVLTSYALAARDLHILRTVHWGRLVLDEAQKIKNASAASTLAVRALANGTLIRIEEGRDDKTTRWQGDKVTEAEVAASSSSPCHLATLSPCHPPIARRVALTGTPVENHLSELWSIMDLLNPGLLGSASDFRQRFAIPVQKMNDAGRADQLRGLIRPFVLRRSKTDPAIASDLPKKMEMKVFCNLTPEQAHHYQRITDSMLGQIDRADGIRRRGLILAALTRLKQICDHPALLEKSIDKVTGWQGDRVKEERDHLLTLSSPHLVTPSSSLDARSGKCERLVEMLEEVLEEKDKALVFTQYRQMGDLLAEMIQRRLRTRVLFLHGGTPHRQRDDLVTEFQSPESTVPIFILSLRAGGLGLNLTAANHVFHFDRWWNPAVENQATDRAYRIGQTRNVQVHKFVCTGTLEERIDALLAEKSALAGRLIAAGDEWLTNLSTTQLRQYLTLSPDAVGEY